jgi:hypothetical protein
VRHWGTLLLVVAVPLLLAACDDGGDDDGSALFPTVASTTAEDTRQLLFDETALEGPDGVMKVLVEDYKMENVDRVDCPADQEVEQGNEFTCTVMIGGEAPDERTVNITVVDDEGEYQVGLPE